MPVAHLEDAFEDIFSYELTSIHKVINKLPLSERIDLLFELEWRIRMSFVPVSLLEWFESSILSILENISASEILEDNRLISLSISLMSYYRQTYNKTEFDRISALVSAVTNTADTENIRRYFYERCLSSVSLLNYQETHRLLSLWTPAPEDYLGILWKCAIMTEVGLQQDAYTLLSKAYQSLQYDAVGATNTMYIDSALSAFESVLRMYEPFPQRKIGFNNNREEYKLYKYFRYEKGRLHDYRDNTSDNGSKSRTHEFNLNHVVTHYTMGKNRDSESRFAGRIQMVWESFGYPYLLGGITIDSGMMKLSSDSLLKSGNGMLALNVLIRSAQKDTIKTVLSKQMILFLDKDKIQELYDHFIIQAENVQNWDNDNSYHFRLWILITEILRRFAVIIDADRIKKLIPILLKIRDSKSRDYSSDTLRTIFNCLPESTLKEIYSELICASIESEENGKDIIFPELEDTDIIIPEEAIELIREAFNSDNSYTRNNAYIRVARIYRMCTVEQQKELAELVISWRNQDMAKNINASYSFNVVPYDANQDTYTPEDRIEWSISTFEDDPKDDNGSKDIQPDDVVEFSGKADDNLCVLEALVKGIPKEQVSEIAKIMDGVLDDILHAAKRDNSTWAQAFGFNKKYQYKTAAYILANLEYDSIDSDICKSICSKLKELADVGYPKLLALSKVNQRTHTISDDEFGNLLKRCVLSHDEGIRKNAFNYMAVCGFKHNENIWRTIWNKIIFSSSPEVADYLSLVMDTSEIHDFDPNSIENLPQIIDEVKVNIEDESWLDGDRYDLQYQMLKLVGFICKSSPNDELKAAISQWIPTDENSERIPNDVLKGFEEGQRIWHKLHKI